MATKWINITPAWEDLASLAVRMARDHVTERDEVESIALAYLVEWCLDPPSERDIGAFAYMIRMVE